MIKGKKCKIGGGLQLKAQSHVGAFAFIAKYRGTAIECASCGTAGESSLQKAFRTLLDWQGEDVRGAVVGPFVSFVLLIAQGHFFDHEVFCKITSPIPHFFLLVCSLVSS